MNTFKRINLTLHQKTIFAFLFSLSLFINTAQGNSKFHALKKGVFVVATSQIKGGLFEHSVILIVDRDDKGTVGVIINRSMNLSLSQVLPKFKGLDDPNKKLAYGGPVSKSTASILVKTTRKLKDLHHVFGTVYFSKSLKTLNDYFFNTPTDDEVNIYAGYAGWTPGQLANEIKKGDWTIVPADQISIFNKQKKDIWRDLMMQKPRLWVCNQSNRGSAS